MWACPSRILIWPLDAGGPAVQLASIHFLLATWHYCACGIMASLDAGKRVFLCESSSK